MSSSTTPAVRIEHDSLGEIGVPTEAWWGAQTSRAVINFPISGIPIAHHTQLIRALAMVKQAAALAKQALAGGRTVRELALPTGVLSEAQLDEVLNPAKLAAA